MDLCVLAVKKVMPMWMGNVLKETLKTVWNIIQVNKVVISVGGVKRDTTQVKTNVKKQLLSIALIMNRNRSVMNVIKVIYL